MNFSALLSVILTLFLLLICGYVCRKRGVIDTTASKVLSRLILVVGQPMLVISSLNKAEYSKENLTIAWQVTLLGFVIHTLIALLAFLFCKAIKRAPDKAKIFEFSLVFGNCAFIGFPILDSIMENGIGSFMGSFYVISFHIFFWTWGILIFARGRSDIKLTPKKVLFNYGTVPCLIGVALYLLKPIFTLPDFAGQFFSYLGNLCTPISVLITGALLATVSLKSTFTNLKLYAHSFIKLILLPLTVCVLTKLCGLNDLFVLFSTVMAAVPSASSVTMLAELYDVQPGYASQVVGLTSILTTASVPIIMLFAQWVIAL